MKINIIDTTLNEGNKGIMRLNLYEKIKVVKFISSMGISQIEIKFDVCDEDLRKEVMEIASLDIESKISIYSKLNIEKLKKTINCGADIIHISIPIYKDENDKSIIKEEVKECINYCIKFNCEATIGLEDASRADMDFIIELSKIAFSEGAKRIRYCDSVGILYPKRILHQIKTIKEAVDVPVEICANDDFGMGIVNSIGAIKAGAEYVVSSMLPVNVKMSNCNYFKFLKSVYESPESILKLDKIKSIHELNNYEIKLKELMNNAL